MTSPQRIEDLRRRVELDPASIAFAHLAEEYRRAGQLDEAIQTCRRGLAAHPEFLSARVTLGRALLALGHFDAAGAELERVLASSPENVPTLRALAEVRRHQGRTAEAVEHQQTALRLAPLDPDLERIIHDISAALGPPGQEADTESSRARSVATVAALERWLEAIRATRAQRRA